jgi:hypothetical protein
MRFGRTVDAVMVRSVAEVGCDLTIVVGFLAEGDETGVDVIEPFVCMEGGAARFSLVAPFGWLTIGAMLARAVMVVVRRAPCSSAFSQRPGFRKFREELNSTLISGAVRVSNVLAAMRSMAVARPGACRPMR